MSRNHPDEPNDPLLESARQILSSSSNTFILAPWRTIMTKNVAASMKAKVAELLACSVPTARKYRDQAMEKLKGAME